MEKDEAGRWQVFMLGAVALLVLAACGDLPTAHDDATRGESTRHESALTASSVDGVTVTCNATTLVAPLTIARDPNSPPAVLLAVDDLRRDLLKVLPAGSTVTLASVPSTTSASIVVTRPGDSLAATYHDPALTEWEAHQVKTKLVGGHNHLVLDGADLRGTLYAIYTFSGRWLGIPPLWYWAQHTPSTLSSISVLANTCRRVGSPEVKYRTLFINNQDYWTRWVAQSHDPQTGACTVAGQCKADRYGRVLEATLRLKANTLWDGDFGQFTPSPSDDWKAEMRRDRGIIIGSWDVQQLSGWDRYWTNFRGATTPPRPNWNKLEDLQAFWRHSIDTANDRGYEVLWLMGQRGISDNEFWEDSDGDGYKDILNSSSYDSGRGTQERTAIDAQLSLFRQLIPEVNRRHLVLHLWGELDRLFNEGYLSPPAATEMVWGFGNSIRDHTPTASIHDYTPPTTQPIGFYFNLQMYSTGSHLVDGEGPYKGVEGFKLVHSRSPGQLTFGMINVGNFREFLLSSQVLTELWWNVGNYNVHGTNAGVHKVLDAYFGGSGATVKSLYGEYLNCYWRMRANDPALPSISRQSIWNDLLTYNVAKDASNWILGKSTTSLDAWDDGKYRIHPAFNGATNETDAIINETTSMSSCMHNLIYRASTGVDAVYATLPASQQRMYNDILRQPVRTMKYTANVARYAASAYKVYKTDPASAISHLNNALYYSGYIRQALSVSAAGPDWNGYFDDFPESQSAPGTSDEWWDKLEVEAKLNAAKASLQ